jgi:integrase
MAAGIIDQFSQWQAGRNLSSSTIRRRQVTLRAFASMVELGDATVVHVETFLGQQQSPATRHAYRCDLAVFYKWAVRRNLLGHDPVVQTDSIKQPKRLPRPVPPEVVPSLVASCPDRHIRLAMALAAYAGLRRAEICALRSTDIRLHPTPMIDVRDGKGGRDRAVPLHPVLATMLAGQRGRIVPLSTDWVGRQAAAHIRRYGIDATLHQLRHTFGTVMADLLTGDLVELGKIMGHSSPQTTLGYVALLNPRSADAVRLAYSGRLRSAG